MANPPVVAPCEAQMSGALLENEIVSTQDPQPLVTQEQHGESYVPDPVSVLLPESKPESFFAPESPSAAEVGQKSSLEALAQTHGHIPPGTDSDSVPHPESTVNTANAARSPTAPGSGPRPRHRIQTRLGGSVPPPPRTNWIQPPLSSNREQQDINFEIWRDHQINENYERITHRAEGISDQLKRGRVRKRARLDCGRIGVVDYMSSLDMWYREWDENLQPQTGTPFPFSKFLKGNTDGVTQRLIVIEDVYPSIITFLVGSFGVSPEFFEEHLINSGYGGGVYDDKSPQTWKTSGMKKSHVSMKWYRPVWRLPMAPFSKRELDDLLNPDVGILDYTRGKSKGSTVELNSNIFRLEWDLRTDPRSTNREKRKCGFEERASVWKGKIPNKECELVILLLDPLPALKEYSVRYQIESKRQGRRVGGTSNEAPGSQTTSSSSLLTDIESGQSGTSRRSNTTRSGRSAVLISRRRTESTRWFRFLPEWLLKLLKLDDYQYKPRTEKIVSPKTTRPVIEHIGSRVPLENTLEEMLLSQHFADKLRSKLYDTTSTLTSFSNYVESVDVGEHVDRKAHFGPLSPLFEIARRDIQGILKILQGILDDIDNDILDDDKMEDRLAIWRQILTRAQLELPQMKRSMVQFFNFPLDGHSLGEKPPAKAAHTDPDMQQCLNAIDEMILRLQSVSSSLTSNMALLDSRRSIAEAQSITRLTELAFLFIPLTFAATIFGMQIDQFKDPVPLSTFIILAITLSGFSYAVRLAIRSSWLISIKHSSKESIKQYADRQRHPVQGGYIPTTLALQWLYQLIWAHLKSAFFAIGRVLLVIAVFPFRLAWALLSPFEIVVKPLIYVGLICVMPLSILWTRKLNHEIQVAMTVACVSSVSIFVFVSFWKASDSDMRMALPRLLKREYELFKHGHSVLFSLGLWIGSACVFLIPIALLWSQPTSSRVKAAFMAALGLVFLAIWATYGIFKLLQLISQTGSHSDTESESGSELDGSESETESQSLVDA